MKHLANALAVLSLFAAAPAFASDVSSDRDFAETRASPVPSLAVLEDDDGGSGPTFTEGQGGELRLAVRLCEER